LRELSDAGHLFVLPEIADYEVRRELVRLRRTKSLRRLDRLALQLEYLPLDTSAMRRAAEFWAEARQQGRPTASNDALDSDVILAAQVATYGVRNSIVATSNPSHISRFVTADLWQNIMP
jgi:predicted nucleic acid-binding protein